MRVQVDAKVGARIMEYVWPARKHRKLTSVQPEIHSHVLPGPNAYASTGVHRSSLDSSLPIQASRQTPPASYMESPPLRKLGVSRSFTDLRSALPERSQMPQLHRTRSSHGYQPKFASTELADARMTRERVNPSLTLNRQKHGDAAEMKTRSSQKTFVLVRISRCLLHHANITSMLILFLSLHLLLSIMKEEAFECREARIRTRDLEYRNQTWSVRAFSK
jgi:hypothetical protein